MKLLNPDGSQGSSDNTEKSFVLNPNDWTIVVHFVLIFLTTVSNGAVLISFVKYWRILIRKPALKTNVFILNLALFDFLIGSITWPTSLLFKLERNRWLATSPLCDVWTCLDNILTRGSVLNVAMLALDRFLGMKMTSQYTVPYQTRNKVIVAMIAFTWLFPIGVYIPLNIFKHELGGSQAGQMCERSHEDQSGAAWAMNLGISGVTMLLLIVPYTLLIIQVLNLRKRQGSTGERSKNRRQPVRMPRSKKPDSFYLNLDPESCFDLSSSIEGNAFTKAGNLQTIWSCDETTSSNNVEKTCRRTGFGFSPRLLKPPSREDWNQIIANDSFEVTQKSFNLSTGQIQVEIEQKRRVNSWNDLSPQITCKKKIFRQNSVEEMAGKISASDSSACSSQSSIEGGSEKRGSLTKWRNSEQLNTEDFEGISSCRKQGSKVFKKSAKVVDESEMRRKLKALERLAERTASSIKQLDSILVCNARSQQRVQDVNTGNKTNQRVVLKACAQERPLHQFEKCRKSPFVMSSFAPAMQTPQHVRKTTDTAHEYSLPEILKQMHSRKTPPPKPGAPKLSAPVNARQDHSEVRRKYSETMVGRRMRNSLSESQKYAFNRRPSLSPNMKRLSATIEERRDSLASFKTLLKRHSSLMLPKNFKIRIWITTPENLKFIVHVLILVAVSVICWAPFSVISTSHWAKLAEYQPITFDLALWLIYLNSFLNPFVYLSQNKSVRKAVQRTAFSALPKCCKHRPDCLRMYLWEVLGCGNPPKDAGCVFLSD
ncbi:uncharacterized protein LOC142339972 [Convolutriloba macropyga]|uniref:uncharacterized protein LOC142339972 n=1 Tax=Convolutriloba macropyga TaxID=536237 RepID=UPI003F524FD2